MKINSISNYLEKLAPRSLAESYDNVGLIVGDANQEVSGILINLDLTESVIDEAIAKKCNLIVTHHPIWFVAKNKLIGDDYVTRCILKAIRNNINLYAIHTNLDNVQLGVNNKICKKLNLKNPKILSPKSGLLLKLETYVPVKYFSKVQNALFEAGAGTIGNYENCSFAFDGNGTFKPVKDANPTIGEIEKLHSQTEKCLEVIFPAYLQNEVLKALKQSHEYEEVAYQLIVLKNQHQEIGSGMIGEFEEAMDKEAFLDLLGRTFKAEGIRYADFDKKEIKKVAVCGGSGSFLIKDAINQRADAFVTGDITYHKFFDGDNKIMLVDIGHYESEQYTTELIFDYLCEKFSNFAVYKSEINTNPVKYHR